MNLFLDTNVFLRFFTKDDKKMYVQAEKILSLGEEGKLRLATSTIVLTEIIFTLKNFYKLKAASIQEHIESILAIKNLLLVERTNFPAAYKLYKTHKEKISDCLIVTQVPQHYKLCSFDGRLKRLIGKYRFILPGKVIKP